MPEEPSQQIIEEFKLLICIVPIFLEDYEWICVKIKELINKYPSLIEHLKDEQIRKLIYLIQMCSKSHLE